MKRKPPPPSGEHYWCRIHQRWNTFRCKHMICHAHWHRPGYEPPTNEER